MNRWLRVMAMLAFWWPLWRGIGDLPIILVATLLGGILASGGILQRQFQTARCHDPGFSRAGLSRHSVQRFALRKIQDVQGGSVTLTNADPWAGGAWCIGVLAGAVRGGTPFLLVSLGECLTEKSGKINLGLEGTLLMGAMTAYAISYKTGSPWVGVLAAGWSGRVSWAVHAFLVSRPKVNDIAAGIAMLIFGSGFAFYLGKPFIQPSAPQLPPSRWAAGVPCQPS